MAIENFGYGNKKRFSEPFTEVIERTRKALGAEGFGVITEIDMKGKFKEKLDKDFVDYVILGACNPAFAYDALNSNMDIGLLLPCNLAIYSQNDETVVSVMDAARALSLTGKNEMQSLAEEVNGKLLRALDSI